MGGAGGVGLAVAGADRRVSLSPPPAPELPGPAVPSLVVAIDPGAFLFRRGRARVVRGEIVMIGTLVPPTPRLTAASPCDRMGPGCGGGWEELAVGVPSTSFAETSLPLRRCRALGVIAMVIRRDLPPHSGAHTAATLRDGTRAAAAGAGGGFVSWPGLIARVSPPTIAETSPPGSGGAGPTLWIQPT